MPQIPGTIDPATVVWDPPKPVVQPQAASTKIDPATVIWDAPKTNQEPPPSRFLSGVRMTMDTARNTVRNLRTNPVETAGEIVAGTAGALAASRGLGGVPQVSRLLGSAIGAGAAAGAYKTVDTAAQVAAGAPPPPVKDVVGQFGESFNTNAAGEGLGTPVVQGAVRLAGRLPVRLFGQFIRNRMSSAARAAAEFVGGKVTLGQVSDSPFVQFMDNIAGATFGRGRYRKVFEDQERQFTAKAEAEIAKFGPKATRGQAGLALREGLVKDAVDTGTAEAQVAARRSAELKTAAEADMAASERALSRVSDRFGPSLGTEATGKASQSLLETAHQAAREGANVLYDEVDRLGAGVKVSLDPLKAFVAQETERRGALAMSLRGGKGTSVLKSVARETAAEEGDDAAAEAAQMIAATDPGGNAGTPAFLQALQAAGVDPTAVEASEVTFRQAHEIRSALGAILRDATRRGDGPTRGVASKLRDAIDTAMKDAAGEGTPLAQAYTDATAAWKGMVERFEEGALAKAIDAHPAEAVKALVGKTGAIEDVTLARETLGDQGWRTVQARVWNDIIAHPSGVQKTEQEILRELQGWSPQELKAVFAGAEDLIGAVPSALEKGAAGRQVAKATSDAVLGAQGRIASAQALKPYSLVERVLNAADAKEVMKLRSLVGDEGWNKVVSSRLQRLFGREGEDAAGIVTGKQMAAKLSREGEKLTAIYGEDTANFLHQFTRHRLQLEKTSPMGSSGKMWLQLATPAAIAGVFTGSVKSAGAILLAPYVMARIATSPQMQRVLIGAMSATEKAEYGTAARLTGQLLGQLVRASVVNPDGSERREDAAGGVQGAAGGPGARAATPPAAAPAGRGPGARGAAGAPPPSLGEPPAPLR